ncbi:MAG: FtsX-like permease family protein [Acidobacteria bacterium]|nr:FtsX-like permease family protein [Acidobacteriota bacterium]
MSSRRRMFFHLLKRGLLGRGDRPIIAFIALAVASTMITAMLSLYSGLESKFNRDFRQYGANVTIAAAPGQSLPDSSAAKAASVLPNNSMVLPFAFVIAHSGNGNPVVVAGTEMSTAEKLNAWWGVSAWPSSEGQALVGSKAEARLAIASKRFALEFGGHNLQLTQVGTLRTGTEEENRVYVPLSTFESWSGVKPSLLEISVPGTRQQVNEAIAILQRAFPGMPVRPVRQLLETEGAVIDRMRSVMLACTALIGFTALLCVFSTLTSSILERRRDFAVMKAIGSSQRAVNVLFAAETLTIALAAGLAGYVLGSGLAAWISEANFHALVLPQIAVLPVVIMLSMLMALVAAALPLARLQRIQPAGILKGE